MKKALSLTFPEIISGQEFLISPDSNSVKSEVDTEDYGTIELEIQRVTLIVADLNRCPQGLSELEANLKTLDQKYLSLSQACRDYSVVDLSASEQQDLLMHELTLEMTFACKRYLQVLDSNTKWVFNLPKKQALAVNNCLFYLSLLKIEMYNLNFPIPTYMWKELYHLYYYAESKKLLKTKFKHDPKQVLTACDNIGGSFIRACFIAAISPFEVTRKESWNLFQYLKTGANSTLISKDLSLIKIARCFIFDLESQQKPKLIEALDIDNANGQRVISIAGFLSQVNKDLSDYASNGVIPDGAFLSVHQPELAEKLLQLMYRYSVQYIRRESDRYPIGIDVETVWGLDSLVEFLIKHEKEAISDNDLKPTLWQSVNESLGGLCIQKRSAANLTIGEAEPLIFKKEASKQQQYEWQLGLSCWNKLSKGSIQVGIKLIAGQLQLVQLSSKENELMVFIRKDPKSGFLLTKHNVLTDKKNIALQLDGKKAWAQCFKTLKCDGADLVQITFAGNF